ncbi:MAG: TonB-dependent receptor [Litorimonas sp.]
MNILDKARLLQTSVLSSLILGLGGAAYAQDVAQVPDAQVEEDDIEDTIIVTGSRIRRTIGDAPVPLTIIDQERAQVSGFNNIADFLSDVPALQGSQVPDDTTGAVLNAAGLSLLNLRNLGVQRTLVLIDGQRQVGSQTGTAAVDVGTIPFIAVERTEVLTGGASSIYGADAVSGVVNFITRQNFEGVRLDAQFAEDREGFNESYRLSGLIGQNFAEDKGNVLLAVEYRKTNELLQNQVDFQRRDAALLRIDSDPVPGGSPAGTAQIADGQPNFALFEGLTLDIINNAGVINTFAPNGISPTGTFFTFAPDGTAIPFIQGTDPRTGALIGTSATLIGGDGTPLVGLSESLTPRNETVNTLARITYELTPNIDSYAEVRYSRTDARTSFQPSFFSGAPNFIGQADANRVLGAQPFGVTAFTAVDNAFLDPNAAAAINGAFGVASVQRFQDEFNRTQDATRELFRIVGGFSGEFTSPINSDEQWYWEANANFGRSEAVNQQGNVRLNQNFFAGSDAIEINQADLDVITAAGNTPTFAVGDVVCRVQFLSAAGLPATIPGLGAVNQNTIDNCVPFSIFGEGATSNEALEFVSADLNDLFAQEQVVFGGNLSGGLFDPLGAGTAQFSLGVEYREDRSETAPDPLALNLDTFANNIAPTSGSFDVYEVFGELEVPLLADKPFAKNLSIGGAARYSDYSTIGDTFVWNVRGDWEPIEDLTFRGGFARSVRAPNIGELFQAAAQSFFQIADPCDINNINGGLNPGARAANCAALGVPVGFVDPNPNISNSGINAGNPNLAEETSDTFFAGATWVPSFFPDLIIDANFFDIEIEDAIGGLGVQNIVNACFDGANGPDTQFCSLFDRDPLNGGEISNILNAPVNIAFTSTRGLDFQGQYRKDVADILNGLGQNFSSDLGSFSLGVQGTYVFSLEAQTNILDDTTFDDAAGEVGVPELRFNVNATYSNGPVALSWRWDRVSSQELFQDTLDPIEDIPSEFLNTGQFSQHDLTIRYDVTDNLNLRAGVVNVFDSEPPLFAQNNIFDIFGRRFFIGATANF